MLQFHLAKFQIHSTLNSARNQAKLFRAEEEGQRSVASFHRKVEASGAQFASTIWGCTGFDGGMEAG